MTSILTKLIKKVIGGDQTMRDNVFIIGDIHGEYELLNTLLKHYNSKTDQLVFIGDLIDRGPQSVDVLHDAMQLVESTDAISLLGNHEEMFLQFLNAPSTMTYSAYVNNGGIETLISMFSETVIQQYKNKPVELAKLIESDYMEEVEFLRNLPVYYQHNNLVCAHAGIENVEEDFRSTSDEDFVWMREQIDTSLKSNITAQGTDGLDSIKVVHGHTPNYSGKLDVAHNVLNIDTGAVFGGKLTGVRLDTMNNVINIYQINNNFDLLIPSF